jgi:hypothetical protein
MSVEPVYRCDLCGEFADKDQVLVVQVGARKDTVLLGHVDVCPQCTSRPISEAITALKDQQPQAAAQ